MNDQFRSVTNVGIGSRLVESIKGVLVGILFFLGSFPLLFWNEGRAVRRAKDLEEGRGAVVAVAAETVDPAMNGKIVHFSGAATPGGPVSDPFGPSATGALQLRRVVEMYQWTEDRDTRRRKRAGGGERRTTHYTYETEWRTDAVDSQRFEHTSGHVNPPMPFQGEAFTAPNVTVGARTLPPALVRQAEGFQPHPVTPADAAGLQRFGRPVQATGEWLYLGANPGSPQVGDVRVKWELAPAGPVSVLAAQQGDSVGEWTTPDGRGLEANLERGVVSADQMFGHLEESNAILTWVLRFVGWLLGFFGVMLVLRPLVTVADVVPFIGSIVGAGSFLAALVISLPLAAITIALGWIAYRPLVAIGVLVAGFLLFGGFGWIARAIGKRKNEARAAARA